MKQDNPSTSVAPERRPMLTREWTLSKACTRWLVAKKVPPNVISLIGMAGGMIAGIALAATPLPGMAQVMFLAAVAGIIVRGMGNLLDGMVAVESQVVSPFGELFNEVPDRIADVVILIGAGYATGGNATLGLLAALVAVLVAYVRAEGKVVGAAQQYCGPMGKPGRMVVILMIALYCGLTPARWQPVLVIKDYDFGRRRAACAGLPGKPAPPTTPPHDLPGLHISLSDKS
ncbi:MAG: CDP-alcohol phosphatidyltransferase family protein [Verrucomicrobia bacterium]|nr:CDP-alcohol phosphatidyltransferase family protein [Verrucomicrobiota bacterium]